MTRPYRCHAQTVFEERTTTMAQPIVIKVGGNEIDHPEFLKSLIGYLAALDTPAVIVHGGGKEIGQLQQQMGLTPQYIDGLRVTDEATLAVVEMVLIGRVNTRLVRGLIAAGIDAVGMNGADRGLIRATKLHSPNGDLGRVGEVTSVRGDVLLALLDQGVTPVIAPVALGEDGGAYNINADHVAEAVAQAIGAEKVVFLTNVSAVLVNGQPRPSLSQDEALRLIADGIIFGGMIPKVQTALHAVAAGVPQAVITDLRGLGQNAGTVFYAASQPQAAWAAAVAR